MIDTKSLRYRLSKVEELIRLFNGTRYLVLFRSQKYDFIYDKIRYFIGVKSGITSVIPHNYVKKGEGYNSLSQEKKTLTLRNFIILIESVFNKNKSNYYANTFLEKALYQLRKSNDNKIVFV